MRVTALFCLTGILTLALSGIPLAADEDCAIPPTTGDEADIDLGKELKGDTIKTRLDFADKCGIPPEQFAYVMRTKGQMHRIHHQLTQQAEALAITLGSETIGDDEKKQAAEKYLRTREQSLAQYKALEDSMIETVGADTNPLAMGALIILGAADSGKRSTCAVHSPVAGGAGTDVHGARGQGNLRQSLGGPREGGRRGDTRTRADRMERWRQWQDAQQAQK